MKIISVFDSRAYEKRFSFFTFIYLLLFYYFVVYCRLVGWLAGWLADLLLYCVFCLVSLIAFCTATTSERVYRQTNSSLSCFPFVCCDSATQHRTPHKSWIYPKAYSTILHWCSCRNKRTISLRVCVCKCVYILCTPNGIRNTKRRVHTSKLLS